MQYKKYSLALSLVLALVFLASYDFAAVSDPDFKDIGKSFIASRPANKIKILKDNIFFTEDDAQADKIQMTINKLNNAADIAAALKDLHYENMAQAMMKSENIDFLNESQKTKLEKYDQEICAKLLDVRDYKIFFETGELPEISVAETEKAASILKLASNGFISLSSDLKNLTSPKIIEAIKILEDLQILEGKAKIQEEDLSLLFKFKDEVLDQFIDEWKKELASKLKNIDDIFEKIDNSMSPGQRFNDIADSTVRKFYLNAAQLSALKKKNPAKHGNILEILKNPADLNITAPPAIQKSEFEDIKADGNLKTVPFYKRYWIIAIVGIVVLSAIGGGAYMMKNRRNGLIIN